MPIIGTGVLGYVTVQQYNGQLVARKKFKHKLEFEDELNILLQLDHPNIISVIGFGERVIYLPLYDGDIRGGKENIGASHKDLSKQLISAIFHMHERNISHCDILPLNILYKKTGNEITFALCDFGFAQQSSNGFRNNVSDIDTLDPLAYAQTVESLDLWDLAIAIIRYIGKDEILTLLKHDFKYKLCINQLEEGNLILDELDDAIKSILNSILKDEDPQFLDWIYHMMSTKSRFTIQLAIEHSWIKD